MLVRLTCVPPGATVNVQQPLHHEPSDAMDDGTRALLILQRSPYTAGASAEQEWPCRVLFDASAREVQVIVRPEASTEQKVTDVLDPKLFQFVGRDVCKIRPARADYEKWMKAVCKNAALTILTQGRKTDSGNRTHGRTG